MKRLLFMLLVAALAIAVFAVEPYELDYTAPVAFTITDAADTARAINFTPSTGLDSFLYHDSIKYPADTSGGDFDTVSWVAPPQQMRITLALDDVVPDTSITYSCSLDLGTNITGFEYDPSGLDDTTLALLIDNLVDSFNNVTTMKDTILAEDSVTYIKIVSKKAQIDLEGDARWTMKVSDSLDTAAIWVTSVADVCDSMVAAINGLDSSHYWTAYDSTTHYTIEGNKNNAGIWFFAVYTDTAQDTTHGADSVSSESTDSGTVVLTSACLGFGVARGKATLVYADDAGYGMGVDSCILHLYSGSIYGGRNLIVAETCASVAACTLGWSLAGDYADSIIDEDLQLWWWIIDTTTDTTLDVSFNLHRHMYMEP